MATPNDPTRLSVAPFTTPQRQRLEAITAAKMLLREAQWRDGRSVNILPSLEDLLETANYIITGIRS